MTDYSYLVNRQLYYVAMNNKHVPSIGGSRELPAGHEGDHDTLLALTASHLAVRLLDAHHTRAAPFAPLK